MDNSQCRSQDTDCLDELKSFIGISWRNLFAKVRHKVTIGKWKDQVARIAVVIEGQQWEQTRVILLVQ